VKERGPQIGARIVQARQAIGLSQAQLAEILDVSPRMVQHYESGASIPYKHFDRLEQLFDVSLGWLMYGEGFDVASGGLDPDLLAGRHDAIMAKLEEIAENVRALRVERERA
jgi:transcriptional regulator with XRE-family HTH domain